MAHIKITAAFWLMMWMCGAGGSVMPVVRKMVVSAPEIPQLVPGDLLSKVTTERQLSNEKNVDQLTGDKINGKLHKEHQMLSPGRIQPKARNTGQTLASTQQTTHIKKSTNSDFPYNNVPPKNLKRFKRQITEEDEDLANEESLETETLSNLRGKRVMNLGYGQSIEGNQQDIPQQNRCKPGHCRDINNDDDDDDDETQTYQPNYDMVEQDEVPRGSSVSSEIEVRKPQTKLAKRKPWSDLSHDQLRYSKLQPKRHRKSGMKFYPKTRTESRSKHNKSLEKRDFNDNELPSDPEILYQTEESQNGSAATVSSKIKQQLQGQIKTQEKRSQHLGYGASIEGSNNQQKRPQRNSCKPWNYNHIAVINDDDDDRNHTASLQTQPDKSNHSKARQNAKPRGSHAPSLKELTKARAELQKPKPWSALSHNRPYSQKSQWQRHLNTGIDSRHRHSIALKKRDFNDNELPSDPEILYTTQVSQNGKIIGKRAQKIGTVSTTQTKNLQGLPNRSQKSWKMFN